MSCYEQKRGYCVFIYAPIDYITTYVVLHKIKNHSTMCRHIEEVLEICVKSLQLPIKSIIFATLCLLYYSYCPIKRKGINMSKDNF